MTEEQKPPQPILIEIDGKPYELVVSRVARFWFGRGENYFIKTHILDLDDDVVRMQARVGWYDGGGNELVMGTGHAEKWRHDGDEINETSALESCETAAIGRALFAIGYSATASAASAEEIVAAKRQEQSARKTKEEIPGFIGLLDDAANKGFAALEECWRTLTKAEQKQANPYMVGAKGITAKAHFVDSQRKKE